MFNVVEQGLDEVVRYGRAPPVCKAKKRSLVPTNDKVDEIVKSELPNKGFVVLVSKNVERWWTEPSMNTDYVT